MGYPFLIHNRMFEAKALSTSRGFTLQAGLLTLRIILLAAPSHPNKLTASGIFKSVRPVLLRPTLFEHYLSAPVSDTMQRSSPITAAGPFLIFTGFPIKPLLIKPSYQTGT